MTTHDDESGAADTGQEVTSTARHASWTTETLPAAEQTEPPPPPAESAADQTDSPAADTGGASSDAEKSFFGDDDVSELRSRWTELQAYFVDDPRESVAKADALLAEVVDHLTAAFATVRSDLGQARGEGASTEDLRLALKRYRAYFRRFLSI